MLHELNHPSNALATIRFFHTMFEVKVSFYFRLFQTIFIYKALYKVPLTTSKCLRMFPLIFKFFPNFFISTLTRTYIVHTVRIMSDRMFFFKKYLKILNISVHCPRLYKTLNDIQ